jgi:hypothetical protein
MAYTELGHDLETLQAVAAEGKSKKLLRALLRLVETGACGEDEKGLVKSAKMGRAAGALNRLIAFGESSKALARTIFAVTWPELEMPEKTALKQNAAKASDLKIVQGLADWAGVPLGSYSKRLDPEDVVWAADVLHKQQKVTVVVTPAALQELLFAVAEGYRVPKGNRPRKRGRPKARYTEVYGLCLGTITKKTTARAGWKNFDVYYTVERCIPQLRADMTAGYVVWNRESMKVQVELAAKILPHMRVLGDFHSHPYNSIKRLRKVKGWTYSDEDEDVNKTFKSELGDMGETPVLGLVIALAKKGKAKTLAGLRAFGRNTVQFTLGQHDYVLAAWVNPVDSHYGYAKTLHCVPPVG